MSYFQPRGLHSAYLSPELALRNIIVVGIFVASDRSGSRLRHFLEGHFPARIWTAGTSAVWCLFPSFPIFFVAHPPYQIYFAFRYQPRTPLP